MDNKPGNNPMGGSKNYKDAFKTPGYTDFKGSKIVDVAHCKVCGQYEHCPQLCRPKARPCFCVAFVSPTSQPVTWRQGMKGRFEHAFESSAQREPAHFSYGCLPGSQFGKVRSLSVPTS